MSLTPGVRLGPYEVTAQIGSGGMGEVWRATDTSLGRQVALKVLPDSFAHDPERLARFEREARTLASLNHPNIAAIHGLETSGGSRALVMEFVDGPTLADRIAQGPLPIDEAVATALQIAEALEAAHEQGVIHRDLKPANIKVRPDGTVKVLDFGLAKALDSASGSRESGDGRTPANSPTITSPVMTRAGMILGTAAYMSPEQARGRTVDRRADVWAFGCVLYEMLTGTRAFPDEDVSDVLASVLAREPDWTRLPPTLSPTLAAYLKRCLHKDPKQRVPGAATMRLALEGAFDTPVLQSPAPAPSSPTFRRVAYIATAAALLSAVGLAIPAVRHLRETPPPAQSETRLDIATPATSEPTSFALSPDGQQIVFVASDNGVSRLWLRSLATTTAQPLAGTEGATYPFWSPDGRSVGFFAPNALRRLDLGGGVPQTLAPVVYGSGGTWNADGDIVFSPARTSPLMRVSASGGAATPVSTLGPYQQAHVWPFPLPDGRRFLFYVIGRPETAGLYLGILDGAAPTRLTPADGAGVYLPGGPRGAAASGEGGWLLWVRAGTLLAQRLDELKGALTGEPVKVADGVAVDGIAFRSALTVAANGLVAYRTGPSSRRQLTWFDRSGTAVGAVGSPDENGLSNPRVSPDGRRVAVVRSPQGNSDIWLLDGARTSRLTYDTAMDTFPLWSPDGARIVFRSNRTGPTDLYQTPASGAGEETPLLADKEEKNAYGWSRQGFLIYGVIDSERQTDLWVVPAAGDPTPSLFLGTPFREVWAAFSPDGRWVAYVSNESGRSEVYVRPFVPPGAPNVAVSQAGGQRPVSVSGGAYPQWRPDGKEVYFLNPAGAMMAAAIAVKGATLETGAPEVLFPTRIFGGGVEAQQGRQYDVAPDGRFLINTVLDAATAPITLLMNWNPDAR